MKRLQNRIAESALTLPVAAVVGGVAWLLAGLWPQQLWPQLACFVATVYLMVELSNHNALLRVRSRMVTSTFIVLSSTAPFLLPQMVGGVVQLCFVVAFLLLFQTYQNPQSPGTVFYAFVSLGLASLTYVYTLWYVPVLWLLMGTQLQALSWRSVAASLLGLSAPYWFVFVWLLMPFGRTEAWQPDLSPLGRHFASLSNLAPSAAAFSLGHALSLVFTLLMAVVGMVHFWQYSFEDKVRIRLLYGFFTSMTMVTLFFGLLQPQHADVLMRILFVCASPLIAHVLTFTSSRLSNILFFVALAAAFVLVVFNLLSSYFLTS